MQYYGGITIVVLFNICASTRVPLEVYQRFPTESHHYHRRLGQFDDVNYHKKKVHEHTPMKVLFQNGTSEEDLPECNAHSICNKVDLYETPWVERQCRCPKGRMCPMTLETNDGHTFVEKTRQYKVCEPMKKIPKCRFFLDTTWTLTIFPSNITDQVIRCHCPKNSLTYLTKRNMIQLPDNQVAFQYLFSCSPQTKFRCQRKEPCRLFTVRKRQEYLDEVNVNTLCQCPHGHKCPRHHTDYGVIPVKSFSEDSIKTHSGYCLPS